MKPSNLLALLGTTLACMALLACGNPAYSEAIHKQVLLKSSVSWDGTGYNAYPQGQPELTLVKLRIAPDTHMDWHTHPMPNAAYVLSGELTVEDKATGATRTLKPGDALAEMVGITHRGKTGHQAVELIVFYAGTPGMPLSQAR